MVLHPRWPRDFLRPERYPEGHLEGQVKSWGRRRWTTQHIATRAVLCHVFIINSSLGMYQVIHLLALLKSILPCTWWENDSYLHVYDEVGGWVCGKANPEWWAPQLGSTELHPPPPYSNVKGLTSEIIICSVPKNINMGAWIAFCKSFLAGRGTPLDSPDPSWQGH